MVPPNFEQSLKVTLGRTQKPGIFAQGVLLNLTPSICVPASVKVLTGCGTGGETTGSVCVYSERVITNLAPTQH